MPDPEVGKLVIIKVLRVMPYGAITEIEGFPGYEGFLHVSEIVSKWVKNISDYISVGMRTAAVVIEVDKNKKVATLSLKRVSEEERKKAFEEHENEKKAKMVIETAMKKIKYNKHNFDQIKDMIMKDYETLHDFMLDIFDEGKVVAEEIGIDSKLAEAIEELVKKSYKKKELKIKLNIKIETEEPNGIYIIKNALIECSKYADIKYLGTPQYMAIIKGEDYKEAKKQISKLKEALSRIEKYCNISIEEES
jgi:translation initiation factor 2 subunit 1